MIRMLSDNPWLVIDDFNLLRSNDETSGTSRLEAQIDGFNDILKELQLREVPLQGQKYTYSNGRPQPTFSRLDRAFLSNQWDMGPLAGFVPILMDLSNMTSNHASLKLTFAKMSRPPKRVFCFERFWLQFEDTHHIIQVWSLANMPINNTRLLTRPKILHVELGKWAQAKFKGQASKVAISK
jgi:hypothetical protein